jgi:hypothetical protein
VSIDARVGHVTVCEDGSGVLNLIDRPAMPGDTPGISGQSALFFNFSPEEVTALNGRDIWGGSSQVMLGELKIADRVGYTSIAFVDRERFVQALKVDKDRRPG